MTQPHFIAIGGTMRAMSSTERALRKALAIAQERGARTTILSGEDINFPPYAPENQERSDAARRYVELLRTADGIIIGSPGYHGAISGFVKNALDYVEDTNRDNRCYFDGLPVGAIATAAGWQAAVGTLQQLRSITHALRGWPTPLGVAINTVGTEGDPIEQAPVTSQLTMMVDQMFRFHAGPTL
ncbi:NADPH-dependent FMN reductase [Novosphingobium aerophilum]|uniref:NADPH-dependent FMN reductase n=1 Tax=Novosphingobium aerophilum TaxID=2839843 RepID=UPI003FD528D4